MSEGQGLPRALAPVMMRGRYRVARRWSIYAPLVHGGPAIALLTGPARFAARSVPVPLHAQPPYTICRAYTEDREALEE
jgi:hypothetical protein